MIRVEIPGRIVAKQSVRFSRSGRHYQPGEVTNYHARCAHFGQIAMAGQAPYNGACKVIILIVLAIPTSWSKKRKARHNWCTVRPDLDNACKAVLDGLKGVVFDDDRQVVQLEMQKLYGQHDRVVVHVELLSQTTIPRIVQRLSEDHETIGA